MAGESERRTRARGFVPESVLWGLGDAPSVSRAAVDVVLPVDAAIGPQRVAQSDYLIVVVDPFVPYVARDPGFADRRGMLYNIDQDVRTISYTRYEAARSWVLRQHPEVSAYTFVPGNRARRLLSVNPMDHRPFLEIWRGAYLSTAARLESIEHRFAGDLRAHGLGFDLAPVRAVVERLEATETPSLADFFPNGRVTPRRTPFCLDSAAAIVGPG